MGHRLLERAQLTSASTLEITYSGMLEVSGPRWEAGRPLRSSGALDEKLPGDGNDEEDAVGESEGDEEIDDGDSPAVAVCAAGDFVAVVGGVAKLAKDREP